MADIQSTQAAAPAIIRRADYRVPDWLIPDIALDFDLDAARTRVWSDMSVARNGDHDRPLRLDGDGLVPLAVKVDGRSLNETEWTLEAGALVVPLGGATHKVEVLVELAPESNSKLMGLYASGGLLCTQCEAEGFRRITDRKSVV